MSHVGFKKCQCRMSLSLNISPVPCPIQEMPMSHVTILFRPMSLSQRVMSPCRNTKNGHVALSILGVYSRRANRRSLLSGILYRHGNTDSWGRFKVNQ